MKKTYYKIYSNLDQGLELSGRLNIEEGIYVYTYESEGTKFPITRLDDVKILARGFNGTIFEVHEEWIPIS